MKSRLFLGVTAIVFIFAISAIAQDTSTTSVAQGQAAQEIQVQSGEVVYVSGNDLIVKMPNGELEHFEVPDNATATVEGKQVTIKDLHPGMTLQRTITTTTRPEVVRTVRTIEGTVMQVNAPSTVILTLPDGQHKQYKIPKDQKFTIHGEEKTAFDLKKGMKIKATIVTEEPQSVVAQETKVSGHMPAPPPMPPMQGALLIQELPTPAAPVLAKAERNAELPQTGSLLPLIAVFGLLLAALGSLVLVRNLQK
jgi:LPXTG-motif cell wall-anchored protein